MPERKIGQMVLNRNVDNFFQETEQVAMAPSTWCPASSPPKTACCRGRVFAYADTQLYRVGTNGLSLPVNRPKVPVNNGNQDGAMNAGHSLSGVNYQPSRLEPRKRRRRPLRGNPTQGTTQQRRIQREQNFKQAGDLYRSYGKKDQQDLVDSFGQSLAGTDSESKHLMLAYLYKADSDYGTRVAKMAGATWPG